MQKKIYPKGMLKKFRREGNLTFTEHLLDHYIHYLHLKCLKELSLLTDQKTGLMRLK